MFEEDMTTASSAGRAVKKQRNSTACDGCRKRKIKCDSTQYPGSRCSNCIDFDIQCTYCQPTKKRGPKSKYVQSLEAKLKALIQDQELKNVERTPESRTTSLSDDSQDLSHLELMDQLTKLTVNPVKERFFGPRSGLMMFKNIMASAGVNPRQAGGAKRPQYWNELPWEWQTDSSERWLIPYIFPDPDLSDSLVVIYFAKIHPQYPILHQPTFEKLYHDGAHLENRHFGNLVLLVCALASRFSDDPRVLSADSYHAELSCGWKWYEQVPTIRKDLFQSVTLYELQACCLSALYLLGGASAMGAMYIITMALRMAEDLGLHRRRPDGFQVTAEYEMLKRNFWVLYSLERIVAVWAGRSVLIRDRDIDVELPVEFCPTLSTAVTDVAFNRYVSLSRIFSRAQKLSRGLLQDDRDRQILTQIDAGLADWLRSLPDHLRWVDSPSDSMLSVFHTQSATINSLYSFIQILVHQSFITAPLPEPDNSVTICINAAKAATSTLEILAKRRVYVMHLALTSFVSGAVLLLIEKEGKALPSAHCRDVERAMAVLQSFENRFYGCGRMRDMMNIIADTVGSCSKASPAMETAQSVLNFSQPQHHPVMSGTRMGGGGGRYGPPTQLAGMTPSPADYGTMFDHSLNINPEHSLYQMLAFYTGSN